jgi:hypothetical protein
MANREASGKGGSNAKCFATGRSECMIDYRIQPIKPKLPIVISWFHPTHSNQKSAIFPCLHFVHLKKHPKQKRSNS